MNDQYVKWPPKDQMIMGVHAIEELLRYAPEKILRVFTVASKQSTLLKSCEQKNIPVSFVLMDHLTKMAGSDSHQSLVAHIKGRTFLDVETFIEGSRENSLVLMLDQIHTNRL